MVILHGKPRAFRLTRAGRGPEGLKYLPKLMRVETSGRNYGRAFFCLLAGVWLAASGCQTYSGPPEKNIANVTIFNRMPDEVQKAVTKVFISHSFKSGLAAGGDLEFTRNGSGLDKLIYGSYVFTDTVTVKAMVMTRLQPDNSVVVTCSAWMFAREDDPVFEGELQMRPLRKGPYQQLLNEVKKQLGE
jgi:hypothetical protein